MECGYCILYIGGWDAAGSYLVEVFAGTPRFPTLCVIAHFTHARRRRETWRELEGNGVRERKIDNRYRCQPHPDFMDKEESSNNGGIRIPLPLEFSCNILKNWHSNQCYQSDIDS